MFRYFETIERDLDLEVLAGRDRLVSRPAVRAGIVEDFQPRLEAFLASRVSVPERFIAPPGSPDPQKRNRGR